MIGAPAAPIGAQDEVAESTLAHVMVRRAAPM